MQENNTDWESVLWSFVKRGNGRDCPGVDSCQQGKKTNICFNGESQRERNKRIHRFLDSDFIDPDSLIKTPDLPGCLELGKITDLIIKLAQKYLDVCWDGSLPVPDNIVVKAPDNLPIETRYVPLKANYGAIWRVDGIWLIHLNSNSSPVRQRFTFYHEIFHILTHCNCDAVFKKSKDDDKYFNELLADYFAGSILMPYDSVTAKWLEIKDINVMADLFNVPISIMYGNLRRRRLI
jgi:hypothetical protein